MKSVFLHSVLSARQVFAFDHCFWSMDESNVPKYAGESKKRGDKGSEILLNVKAS